MATRRNDRRNRCLDAAEIGDAIRRRRKELGYTQQNLADFSGLSRRLIGEIEAGRGTVGIQKVIDLCTGIGIDVVLEVRGSR